MLIFRAVRSMTHASWPPTHFFLSTHLKVVDRLTVDPIFQCQIRWYRRGAVGEKPQHCFFFPSWGSRSTFLVGDWSQRYQHLFWYNNPGLVNQQYRWRNKFWKPLGIGWFPLLTWISTSVFDQLGHPWTKDQSYRSTEYIRINYYTPRTKKHGTWKYPLWKRRNHLQRTHFWGFHVCFRGCTSIIMVIIIILS